MGAIPISGTMKKVEVIVPIAIKQLLVGYPMDALPEGVTDGYMEAKPFDQFFIEVGSKRFLIKHTEDKNLSLQALLRK